jgi:transposase-like protein
MAGAGVEINAVRVVRSRRLRGRFSPEDLQTMIDLYRSGITAAKQVAERFGVSLRSVKRLLHQHGVHRDSHAAHAMSGKCIGDSILR